MPEFYFPYHFIPVSGRINGDQTGGCDYKHDPPFPQSSHTRHDLWVPGAAHGRILCELYTRTPTVTGNKHIGKEPTTVEQYRVDNEVAIAASTLRGVISSTAEALSQSALRVLSDDNAPEHVPVRAILRNQQPELAPWNPGRERLTAAEQLFGVVEEMDPGADNAAGRNLKSRVSVSDARLSPVHNGAAPQTEEITLKELLSPNPLKIPPDNQRNFDQDKCDLTCNWYLDHDPVALHGAVRKAIERNDPEALRKLRIKGRKFFVARGNIDPDAYESDPNIGLELKSRCNPVSVQTRFYFHLDFDNLQTAELGLLLRALCPHPKYRHRIGLGKPLGLGQVQIHVHGIFLIDRSLRYSAEGLLAPRYSSLQSPDFTTHWESSDDWKKLPEYTCEAACTEQAEAPGAFIIDDALVDAESLHAVQRLGCPDQREDNIPVRAPESDRNGDPENNERRIALNPLPLQPGARWQPQDAENPTDPTEETPTAPSLQNQLAQIQPDEARDWIRSQLLELGDQTELNPGNEDTLKQKLHGKGLSTRWNDLEDGDFKNHCRNGIVTLLKSLKIVNDLNNLARRRYGLL